METSEIIFLASKAFDKSWSYEDLVYSDDLHNYTEDDDLIEEIWNYVIEIKDIGRVAFSEKYKEYKLYF